ncbi:hypothetical protein BpHYR1_006060 [Brachionus plicatilis]|uniref:Uncharacterized protein n=1 Tax=Brachionus plicatilis TaxID=10195 RepID=A0A3M7RCU0_BRAPC|nr:hypothetical protein BpHYR1_006060 [Brachionus plicatilis]
MYLKFSQIVSRLGLALRLGWSTGSKPNQIFETNTGLDKPVSNRFLVKLVQFFKPKPVRNRKYRITKLDDEKKTDPDLFNNISDKSHHDLEVNFINYSQSALNPLEISPNLLITRFFEKNYYIYTITWDTDSIILISISIFQYSILLILIVKILLLTGADNQYFSAVNSIQGNFLYSGYLSKDRTVRYKLYLFVFLKTDQLIKILVKKYFLVLSQFIYIPKFFLDKRGDISANTLYIENFESQDFNVLHLELS